MEILKIKLEEEVWKKSLILEMQTEFRKGKSMMDNIFVLNQTSKQVEDKKRKVNILFVDLKAAFDKVDRSFLLEVIKEIWNQEAADKIGAHIRDHGGCC